MNIFKEHIEYLKDNPEGYWFKSKLYGYGWTPANPAGWATMFAYIAFLLVVVLNIGANDFNGEIQVRTIALIVGGTILMLVITWRTGEPLKWQWGQPDKKEEK